MKAKEKEKVNFGDIVRFNHLDGRFMVGYMNDESFYLILTNIRTGECIAKFEITEANIYQTNIKAHIEAMSKYLESDYTVYYNHF